MFVLLLYNGETYNNAPSMQNVNNILRNTTIFNSADELAVIKCVSLLYCIILY